MKVTKPFGKWPRMSQEAVLRHAWSLIAVVGLCLLTVALGGRFGLWAAGALLLLVGAVFAVPLWWRQLEEQSVAREVAKIPQHEYPPEDGQATGKAPTVSSDRVTAALEAQRERQF